MANVSDSDLKVMNKMMDLLNIYRGTIIGHLANLEYQIEDIIVDYFTDNDKKRALELKCVLIANENFNISNKRKMVMFIIESSYPEYYKKNKKLNEYFEKLISFRNKLAHCKIQFNNELIKNFDNNAVTMFGYTSKDNKVKEYMMVINKKMIDDYIVIIKDVFVRLRDLYYLINPSGV